MDIKRTKDELAKKKNRAQMIGKIKPVNDKIKININIIVSFEKIINNNCFHLQRCFYYFIVDIERSNDELG